MTSPRAHVQCTLNLCVDACGYEPHCDDCGDSWPCRWAPAATPDEPPSFTCPACGAKSFNPNDIREGYCGRCHDWTGSGVKD